MPLYHPGKEVPEPIQNAIIPCSSGDQPGRLSNPVLSYILQKQGEIGCGFRIAAVAKLTGLASILRFVRRGPFAG